MTPDHAQAARSEGPSSSGADGKPAETPRDAPLPPTRTPDAGIDPASQGSAIATPLKALLMAGYGIVSLTGAFFGYQVGQQIDGVLIGVIMAINAAIFCALLFSIVAGWVERAAGRRSNPNSQNPGTRHTR